VRTRDAGSAGVQAGGDEEARIPPDGIPMNENFRLMVRRSASAGLKIAVVGALLVLVAAVSAYVTVRRSVSGGNIQVPELIGMTADEATVALRKQALMLEPVAERHDPHVEAGRILAQEPASGSTIKTERKVKVVLSLGEEGAVIPDLRGSAARGAQIALQQQGYRMSGQVYTWSARQDENQVIAQDPPAGGAGVKDGRVSLLVSRGRPPVVYVMPDLTGRPESEAVRFLQRAGLRPGPARHQPDAPGAPGTVVAQRPEAGYPVRAGDLVSLTLAGAGE
jgi:beta-lactam-binding protein with PASTA domain